MNERREMREMDKGAKRQLRCLYARIAAQRSREDLRQFQQFVLSMADRPVSDQNKWIIQVLTGLGSRDDILEGWVAAIDGGLSSPPPELSKTAIIATFRPGTSEMERHQRLGKTMNYTLARVRKAGAGVSNHMRDLGGSKEIYDRRAAA